MHEHTFEAIGTKWCVTIDGEAPSKGLVDDVHVWIDEFDRRFSRFKADSEACAFRNADAGSYEISPEFAQLLARSQRLRNLTGGAFDPAVGALLEEMGYDPRYSFVPKNPEAHILPSWELVDRALWISGPVVFDIGGTGKGYCIDQIADLVRHAGHEHYLVDAGGDIYGSTKRDGSPWRIALQYPGKPDMAIGSIALCNQAVAVSDSFIRRWKEWHHIIDPISKTSVQSVVGAIAVAKTAYDADCMTSGLFLGTPEQYPALAQEYGAAYLVVNEDCSVGVSANWEGELFV